MGTLQGGCDMSIVYKHATSDQVIVATQFHEAQIKRLKDQLAHTQRELAFHKEIIASKSFLITHDQLEQINQLVAYIGQMAIRRQLQPTIWKRIKRWISK